MTSATDLVDFLNASPSPFHAVAEAARRLAAAGFTEVAETDAWPVAGRHFVVRGGSLAAWAVPDGAAATAPYRVVGAHTDSPNLRVKPRPDRGFGSWSQLGVEVYGGPMLNSWLDRDLGLSGRVSVRGIGGIEMRLLRVDRPVLRIPQLAIHFDRDVNTTGLVLNAQRHLDPVWALDGASPGAFVAFVAKELDVDSGDILAWDVMTHDVVPGCIAGRDGEFVSSGRIDNLCSCWAATTALASAEGGDSVAVIALFDHEEVGSNTERGAASPFLATVIERIGIARGGSAGDTYRALAQSVCVSADMAHATNPNYADRHEPGHLIEMNGGPAIKTNVSARYATDAVGAATFLEACDRAGVPVQQYVHRNDLPCGSTIGPITAARLGIPTVDVGAPQLSMHACRELMGTQDADYLRRALTSFLRPSE